MSSRYIVNPYIFAGIKAGLKSWWELGEASGTRSDSHGSNDLTENGTVSQITGVSGNASESTSSSNYLSKSSPVGIAFGDVDFSIACWMRSNGNPANNEYGFELGDGSGGSDRSYWLQVSASGPKRWNFRVSNDGSSTSSVQFGSNISSNTWHFIYAFHDAANNLIGINQDDGTEVTSSHTTGVNASAADFEIHGTSSPIGGADSFGIWGRLLSAAEQTWLYNSGSGRAYSDL